MPSRRKKEKNTAHYVHPLPKFNYVCNFCLESFFCSSNFALEVLKVLVFSKIMKPFKPKSSLSSLNRFQKLWTPSTDLNEKKWEAGLCLFVRCFCEDKNLSLQIWCRVVSILCYAWFLWKPHLENSGLIS